MLSDAATYRVFDCDENGSSDGADEDDQGGWDWQRKRKWQGALRPIDLVPIYEVKRSKKDPSQQLAVEWLTKQAKCAFDEHLARKLAPWGVAPAHKGTCVLIPADWAPLDPMKLMEMFTFANCPLNGSERPVSTRGGSCLYVLTAPALQVCGSYN